MNLTWHLIKKDLLCLRLPALLWVAVLAGQVYVSNSLLSTRSLDLNWFYRMGGYSGLLEVGGLLVTYLLVALLILDDPLAGTTMFWVTRPIKGGRLLCAKLFVAFLLFGLLPLLVWFPWFLYCGFGPADLAQAALRILGLQAIAVVPAFVLAVLVDQLGRFLLFSLLLMFAGWVALLNVASQTYTGIALELLKSRWLVAGGLLLLFGSVGVGRQYLTRKLASTAVVLATGILVAGATVCWSPLNLSRMWAEHRTPLAGADRIAGEIKSARMGFFNDADGVRIDTVAIDLRFTGGQEDVNLAGGLAAVELRWADGFTVRQERLKVTARGWAEGFAGLPIRRVLGLKPDEERWARHWDAATSARQAELRKGDLQKWDQRAIEAREAEGGADLSELTVTVPLTPEQAARIVAEPPACSVTARIGARAPEAMLEIPFKSGGHLAGHGERLHILGIGQTRRPERKSALPTDWCMATVVSVTAPGFKNGVHLYRVDRDHGVLRYLGGSNAVFSSLVLAANIACAPIGFESPVLWRNNQWVEAPGWQERSTLVAVTFKDAGGFDRAFHTDRLAVAKIDSDETVR